MTLFFMILAAVAAIATIVFYILDEKTGLVCDILAHSFFISTILLLFTALSSYLFMAGKARNNCENVISDYYEGCVFVDKFEEENGKKKFIYNEKVYEVTIDLGTVATKWNYKDIDYTITITEPDGTANVITPKEKSEIKNGGK